MSEFLTEIRELAIECALLLLVSGAFISIAGAHVASTTAFEP